MIFAYRNLIETTLCILQQLSDPKLTWARSASLPAVPDHT